jgi:uncharacterized damage-inducible protein DinB
VAESLLIKAFRYNRWANLHLLDVCAGLPEHQLRLTADGTYGSIAATFQHLLGAEQRYIRRLVGIEPRVSEKDPFPGIATLTNEAEQSGDRLIELAATVTSEDAIDDPQRLTPYSHLDAWVVLIQALHHGNDHRTHICTILGTHAIDYGDMDVWAYGRSLGAAAVPATA